MDFKRLYNILCQTLIFIGIIAYEQDINIRKTNTMEKINANISLTKCLEYSARTSETFWIKKFYPQKIRLKCKKVPIFLMVNGKSTEPYKYPHMVALLRFTLRGEPKYHCIGSLISERWVLTVAHCLNKVNDLPNTIVLGSKFIKSVTNSNQLIAIKRIIKHPDYRPPLLYADLALIELSESVNFSSTIKPACLYPITKSEPKQLWASSWSDDSTKDNLIEAPLQYVSAETCSKLYRNVDELQLPRGIDTTTQLCARALKNGKADVCSGDSGAPLQVRHPLGCLVEIVALTSFGVACGSPSAPGVYIKVAPYIGWIESIVWNE